MQRTVRTPVLALVVVAAAAACAAVDTPGPTTGGPPEPPPTATPGDGASAAIDPLRLRHDLLARMDADVEAAATAGHLRARVLLDEVLPVPYLGFDADPVPAADASAAGMRVTKVYPETGAEACGLADGDVVLAVGGTPTPDGPTLGATIRRFRVGDTLTLRVRRGADEIELRGPLGHRPEEDEDEEEQFPELFGTSGAVAAPVLRAFGDAPAGAAPPWIVSVLGGHGLPPAWVVVAEGGERFLRQEDGDPTGIRFPMAILDGLEMADGTVAARIRLTGGRQDRAAGLVLRYRDPGNYLVARVNATENDLRIFRCVNGRRRTLPGGRVEAKGLGDGAWHTLTFTADGAKLTARVDDGKAAESYDTYFLRGGVGLWTKSDAVSDFDDVRVTPRR